MIYFARFGLCFCGKDSLCWILPDELNGDFNNPGWEIFGVRLLFEGSVAIAERVPMFYT